MFRSTLSILLLSFATLSLGACTKEDSSSDDDDSSEEEKDTKKSKDTAEPKGDDDDGDDDDDVSIGPQCAAYVECCDELAEDQPSMAESCDTLRKSIDDAIEQGVSADSYEAGCKSAVSSFKSAGYCK